MIHKDTQVIKVSGANLDISNMVKFQTPQSKLLY